jgi:hypothetical protein
MPKPVKINLSGLYQALGQNAVIFFYDTLSLRSIQFKDTVDALAAASNNDYFVVYIDVNKYLDGIFESRVGAAILGQPVRDCFLGGRAPVLVLTTEAGESGFCLEHLPLTTLRREVGLFFGNTARAGSGSGSGSGPGPGPGPGAPDFLKA